MAGSVVYAARFRHRCHQTGSLSRWLTRRSKIPRVAEKTESAGVLSTHRQSELAALATYVSPLSVPIVGLRDMKKILFIGQEPETVDFSDPALPPGFDAKKIRAGIDVGMRQVSERGWHADLCLVRPDGTATSAIERQLSLVTYDCVVI